MQSYCPTNLRHMMLVRNYQRHHTTYQQSKQVLLTLILLTEHFLHGLHEAVWIELHLIISPKQQHSHAVNLSAAVTVTI